MDQLENYVRRTQKCCKRRKIPLNLPPISVSSTRCKVGTYLRRQVVQVRRQVGALQEESECNYFFAVLRLFIDHKKKPLLNLLNNDDLPLGEYIKKENSSNSNKVENTYDSFIKLKLCDFISFKLNKIKFLNNS